MVVSRRRRGRYTEADRALRAVLGDAGLLSWWDIRFPGNVAHTANAVTSWMDPRGTIASQNMSVTAATTQCPTYSNANRTLTFDGTANRLRSISANLGNITAGCAIVIVTTLPATAGASEDIVSSDDATTAVLYLRRAASNGDVIATGSGVTASVASTGLTGTRVLHGRRSAVSGGNVTMGVRVGSGAETTASGAATDLTMTRFAIGANPAGTGAFSDIVAKAVLLIKGDYTAAKAAAVNEWAKAVHGVTL